MGGWALGCRMVVLPLPFWTPAFAGVSVLDVKGF